MPSIPTIVERTGNTMQVEVPADISPGLAPIWGVGDFGLVHRGQVTRLAPRRVLNMESKVLVCENDPVTTVFFVLDIDLAPAEEITRPVVTAPEIAPPLDLSLHRR